MGRRLRAASGVRRWVADHVAGAEEPIRVPGAGEPPTLADVRRALEVLRSVGRVLDGGDPQQAELMARIVDDALEALESEPALAGAEVE